ncbi:MAG: GNVR domain-containing protein [Deltaproteobacteria bacterium]
MTQLKLRLGEKLADKALAFASNEQEKYQKLNKEIEALQNEVFLQENLIKDSETHGVKVKGKHKIFESLVSQESMLLGIKQKIEQKLTDLKNRRVEILSSATLPESPIKPKTRLIVTLSAVVSLFAGIFLVFVIEFIKNARSRLQENEEGLSPA